MHLVLARDILPNNTSAIRPILAPSVQQQGRGRAPSSPITDRTDYLSTVPQELGRDYQNPVRTAWTAVWTGLCGTLLHSAVMKPEMSVSDYISSLSDISQELEGTPDEVKERYLIMGIFATLAAQFANIVVTLGYFTKHTEYLDYLAQSSRRTIG